MKNDSRFIASLSSSDKDFYFNYIHYIDHFNSSFNSEKNIFYYDSKENTYNMNQSDKTMKTINEFYSAFDIFPYKEFIKLNEESKAMVKNAKENSTDLFLIGKSLIEGIDPFSQNTSIGIRYLKKSFKNGCIQSLIYYCRMMIKGSEIPLNLQKARKIAQTKISNESLSLLLLGLTYKKEKNFVEAKNFFEKAKNLGNNEAMYEIGKMYLKGIEFPTNENKAKEYFLMSINFTKSMFKYGLLLKDSNSDKENIQNVVIYI